MRKKDKKNYERNFAKGGPVDSKMVFRKIYFRRKYTWELKI